MGQAFVIMQIGNPELDTVYKDCIAPAVTSCGLEPRRVDKHTEVQATNLTNLAQCALI